jgi:PAS domain S-box-containing protein
MEDRSRTKQALIQELASLKLKIKELERATARCKKEREERKKTEASSLDTEARYRLLFEHSPDGILIIDPDTARPLEFNETAHRQLGYTREEFAGLSIFDLEAAETPEETRSRIALVLKDGRADFETRQRTRQGEIRDVHVTAKVTDILGQLSYHCVWRDITSRKRAEEALAQSEERFRKAFYTTLDSVNINRLEDGLYISINPGFTKIMGYTEEDIVGKTSLECNIWEKPQDRQRLVAGLKEAGQVIDLEAGFRTKSGEIRHGLMSASIIDLHGVPHILSITRDISDRTRAVEALKESESKYRLLAENVNDVIFLLDMDLNYTYISPSVKLLRGYEPEEVLKQRSIEALTPSSWDSAIKALSEVMALERSGRGESPTFRVLPLETVRKDGTIVWTEVKFSLVRDDHQRPVAILGVSRDISERIRAEEALQRSLASLRNAVGATIQVMVSAVEIRDPYTAGHQLRTADLARAIAEEMGLSRDRIDGIRMAGSIHDIGKLSVPSEILSKPTKLTDLEFSLIKEHSERGYEMLKDVESPWPLAEIVHQHHERMDGSGYPKGLEGDEILMEARIMAVADVVESMASHRPYRPALGTELALEEIGKNRGILYDEAVADACLRLFREKDYKLP